MKSAAFATILLALAAAGVGTALADGLPTLPTPTVTVPTLPVSTPTVTSLPAPPPAPTPVPTTGTTSLPAPVSGVTSTVTSSVTSAVGSVTGRVAGSGTSAGDAGATSGAAAGGAGSPGGSTGTGVSGTNAARAGTAQGDARSAPKARLRPARAWIARRGTRGAQRTTLRFVLSARVRIRFVLVQVAPTCRIAGSFSITGHRGVNRVPFNGRIQGRALAPGTYRIEARTATGRPLFQVILLVFATAPTPSEVAAARRSNVCPATAARLLAGALAGVAGGAAGAGGPSGVAGSAVAKSRGAKTSTLGAGTRSGHGAGVIAGDLARHVSNPFVLATLAAAIVLLGLAALPRAAIPNPRLTYAIARHRSLVLIAGAATLVAAVIAVSLGG